MNHSEKLLDPRWKKKRLEILQRDEFKCRICLDNKTELQIHHVKYEKNKAPWECNVNDLRTICKNCHARIESVKISVASRAACCQSELEAIEKALVVITMGHSQSLSKMCDVITDSFDSGVQQAQFDQGWYDQPDSK